MSGFINQKFFKTTKFEAIKKYFMLALIYSVYSLFSLLIPQSPISSPSVGIGLLMGTILLWLFTDKKTLKSVDINDNELTIAWYNQFMQEKSRHLKINDVAQIIVKQDSQTRPEGRLSVKSDDIYTHYEVVGEPELGNVKKMELTYIRLKA